MPKIGIGRGVGFGTANRSNIEIGQVFTDTFDRLSLGSNWTTTGTPTVSLDGTDLNLSNGATAFNRHIKYNAWTTCLNKWTLVMNFQIVDKTATSHGVGLGIKTASAFGNRSVFCQFSHTTGVNGGKTFIYAGTAAPDTYAAALATSAAITFSAGDEIRMTVTRDGLNLSCLTQRLVGGVAVESSTIDYDFPLTIPSTTYQHNTGNPFIVAIGGNQKIHDITYSSQAKKNIYALFVGDSITHGVAAGTEAARWVNQLMTNASHVYEINAGGGDYTAPALAKIQEILLQNPQYLVLCIGGNDIRFGVASGTWQANYASIVSQAQAAGITVINCTVPADSNDDVSAHKTYLDANHSNIVDFFTLTRNGATTDLKAAYDAGDGTHPNATCHADMATTANSESQYLP